MLDALQRQASDWESHFRPDFALPPPPAEISPTEWPQIAEHIARAERVGQAVRSRGLEFAVASFADSPHAIEHATLVSAASQSDAIEFAMIEALLGCEIDELVVYGQFLDMLPRSGEEHWERALAAYENFCAACQAAESTHPMWGDRVGAVTDGLASYYVNCGRHDDAERIFAQRHEQCRGDLVVSLAASRAFLSAGHTARAVRWLDRGAERAKSLGRADMEQTLASKRDRLRRRLS